MEQKPTAVKPTELKENPFQLIGRDWMLVAAENDNTINAMTAGWGGFGVMWGKDVAFIVVRPQRYTKMFLDAAETFSLSFFDAQYKQMLSYFGTVSGRDEDKIAKTGLTVVLEQKTPYFKESRLTMICRKLYRQSIELCCFTDTSVAEQWYPEQDYHDLYIGEILTTLLNN